MVKNAPEAIDGLTAPTRQIKTACMLSSSFLVLVTLFLPSSTDVVSSVFGISGLELPSSAAFLILITLSSYFGFSFWVSARNERSKNDASNLVMELETIVAIAEGSSTEIEEYYLQTDLRIKQIKEFLDDTVKNWDQYCIQLEKSGVNAETIHLIRNQQINPIRKIQDRLNIQAPNLFSTPQYNDTISMARNSLNKAKIEVKTDQNSDAS